MQSNQVGIKSLLGEPIGTVSSMFVTPLVLPKDGSYPAEVVNSASVRRIHVRYHKELGLTKGLRSGSIIAVGDKTRLAIATVTCVALEIIHANITHVLVSSASRDILFCTNWNGKLINESNLPKLEGGRVYWLKKEARSALEKLRVVR